MFRGVENELFTHTHAYIIIITVIIIITAIIIIIIETHRVRSAAMRRDADWGELSNRKGRGRRKFENLIRVGEARRPRYRYRKATHTQ